MHGTGADEMIAGTDTCALQARLESYRRLSGLLAEECSNSAAAAKLGDLAAIAL